MTDTCPHSTNAEDCLACMDNRTDAYVKDLKETLALAMDLLEYAYERVPVGMRGEEKWEAAQALITEWKRQLW